MLKYSLIPLLLTTGCTFVGTGEIGIKKDYFGQVDSEPLINTFEVTFFDSVVKVDGTQVRVPVKDIRAKDADGILFKNIDVQAHYVVIPEGVVPFYKQTKEIDCIKQYEDHGDCENTLGYNIVRTALQNIIPKAVSKVKASVLNTDKTEVEVEAKELLQARLNELYPNTFKVTNVNVNSAVLDDTVERTLQTQATLDSERKLIESKKILQKQQIDLLREEMQEMRSIAEKSGISLAELMRFRNDKERNKVLGEFAKNNQGNTQIQISDKDQK